MTSPFDLAAAYPMLDEPSKKKWIPGAENSPEHCLALSSNDFCTTNSSSGGPNMIPISQSGIVILSHLSGTKSSFDAFNDIDLEDGRLGNKNYPIPTNNNNTIPFNIDTICIPGDDGNHPTSDTPTNGTSYPKKMKGT
jgi:hypothetical protein